MSDSNKTPILLAAGAAFAGAAAAIATMKRNKRQPVVLPSGVPTKALTAYCNNTIASSRAVTRGTLVLCTQNLAVSGANQVLLNLVEGTVWNGNVVLLSPTLGPFAKEFADLGVSVHIGTLGQLRKRITDIRLAICNTIMTAHNVLELDGCGVPQIWVLHEWWPHDMLVSELTKRNDKNTTPAIVGEALRRCSRTVCVCKSQLELYKPQNGTAVFVGVPTPTPTWRIDPAATSKKEQNWAVTFLCLGIVCPRKNQHWAVEVFKKWAADRKDVRLLVVGARYIRKYETDYVEKVKAIIGNDKRVELHDVTNDVDAFYRKADVLLFTSLNEVTPMVIAESMMRSMPVITTDIAGIPEMFTSTVHGFCLPAGDEAAFADALTQLGATDAEGQRKRLQMGAAAKKHAVDTFTNDSMVSAYRNLALELSPPVILLDMDGVLVDWDAGFLSAWSGRSPVNRQESYAMEKCVPPHLEEEARAVFHADGFFANLPPMPGAVAAVKRMAEMGYKVMFCTSPVLTSGSCPSEKFEWIRKHFGAGWVGQIVMTSDKTVVRGDVLIDDKPRITGSATPVWKQLMFAAPYNRSVTGVARLEAWDEWEEKLTALLSEVDTPAEEATTEAAEEGTVSAALVAQLPDFSHLLPPDYAKGYSAWRSGQPKGAKGELFDAVAQMAAMQDSLLNNASEDFTEVSVFRGGYANWRRGGVSGAKGSIMSLRHEFAL